MSFTVAALYFIGFLGAVQALVIGSLVGTMAAPRTRWYGALVGLLGVAMGLITLSHMPVGRALPWLYTAEVAVGLLAPPLFRTWAEMVLRRETRPRRTDAVHFLAPTVWVGVAGVLLALGRPVGEAQLPILAVVAVQVAYTAWIGWRTWSAAAAGDGGAEAPDEVGLLKITVGLFAGIHVAQLLRAAVDAPVLRPIVPLASAAAIFTLTGLALRHSRLLAPAERRAAKYEGSSLGEAQAEAGHRKLLHALEEDRAYLRPDLTLDALAAELDLARGHLSQIVNERCGRPFPELLADYRVRHAERLLTSTDAEHLTVESVGYRAGFASRSAFYEAFKRSTGLTPAAYRRRHLDGAG